MRRFAVSFIVQLAVENLGLDGPGRGVVLVRTEAVF